MGELIRLEGVLLSCDAEVVSVMNQVLDSFEIEAEVCQEPLAALKAIAQRKLDTVIVDWDRRDEPDRVLSALRASEKNAKSTAVAIISGAPEMQAASRASVNVMIYKPMNIDQATHCLRAAYGNILLQRRRARASRWIFPLPARSLE
jgi:DNA-binding NtrC family response regulator